jgi:hypothetical protein
MKRLIVLMVIIYFIIIFGVIFFVFGGGISKHESLKWNNIETMVPSNFEVKLYKSKGWDVYSLRKYGILVKIALKPEINIFELPGEKRNILYELKSDSKKPYIFYVIKKNLKKGSLYEVVFAKNIDDVSLYFSVTSPSFFFADQVMNRVLDNLLYKGKKIDIPEIKKPIKLYLFDLIFIGVMFIPIIVIFIIFRFSGKKPNSRYFFGDVIICEESFVFFSERKKLRKVNGFCYFVLTNTRLMLFYFMKPKLEIKINEEEHFVNIKGKKIILKREESIITVIPSDIEKWKPYLSRFIVEKDSPIY